MGLDAVVYKNVKNLDADVRRYELKVDPVTGEAYMEDGAVGRTYPAETFQAINRRLGNVSAARTDSKEISQVSQPNDILRGKVLKSFSHSGDVIGGDELEMLEKEVRLIRDQSASFRSTALTEFLDALEQLIEAAKKQENAIVFV